MSQLAFGILWFGEPSTALKTVSLALIFVGVVGLNQGGAHRAGAYTQRLQLAVGALRWRNKPQKLDAYSHRLYYNECPK